MSMVSIKQDTAETHIILGNMFRNRGEVDRAIRIHQNIIARPELHPSKNKAGMLTRASKRLLKIWFFR
jgi:lipopolysaccharide biosynthesis regulator YciM